MRFVNEHVVCLDNAENLVQSGHGHVAVHWRVEAACSDNAEEAGGCEDVSARHNHYRRTRGYKTREICAD